MGASAALLTVAGTLLLPASGADAAPPSPSLILSGGPSGQANTVTLESASSGGILYAAADPSTSASTIYLRSSDGTTTTVPSTPWGNNAAALVGDLLGVYDYANQTFSYRTVDDALAGTVAVSSGTFRGVSPDGYFSTEKPDGVNLHLYDTAVATSTAVDLGAVPGNPVQVSVIPGDAGALVVTSQQEGGWGPRSLYFRSYEPSAGYVPLAEDEPLYGTPALGATSAAWLENPGILTGDDTNFPFEKTTLLTVNLDGTGKWSITAPDADAIAIAGDYIGFGTIAGAAERFSTVPLIGGTVTTFGTPVNWAFGSTGDAFILNQLGTPASAGLYSHASAADAGTQLTEAGAAALQTTAVALEPGRAIWSDNGIGANLWGRDLSLAGSTPPDISAGSPQAISPTVNGQPLSASGGRVAYFDTNSATGGSDLWLREPDGTRQKLGSSNDSYRAATLSGTRLLQNNFDGSAVLYDLVHGTTTSFAAPSAENPISTDTADYQLSGNDLAFIASDGGVWVQDLESGARTQVAPAVVGTGEWTEGNVAIAGDNVAWLVYVCRQVSQFTSECLDTDPVQYRDFRTMAPAYGVDAASPDFALSENYLAFRGYTGTGWELQVNPLYTPTVETIGPLSSKGLQRNYTASGSTVAWIGDDGLPHVQALDHLPAPPRYLGNGTAPTSLLGDGVHAWTADFVASESLTSCSVSIYQEETAVRTIACDSTLAHYGEATVTWDGKDAGGHSVPAGSYSWVLNAANDDGRLLNADGADEAIGGSVDVRPPSTGGGGGGGGGGGAGGGGTSNTSGTVAAGGTVWSGGDPDASNPITVGVTTPAGGTIDISAHPDSTPHPGGRGIETFAITAPTASAAEPLRLTFKVYLGDLPAGSTPSDLQLFRDGARIAACGGGAGATAASPDPCIAGSSITGDVVTVTVLSSHASTWQLETADVGRLAGADRFATAAAISAAAYPSGGAAAVVLASADAYPDALVGAPLAARYNAPILLTSGAQLPAATKAELQRVLADGGLVYVLGGTVAVPLSIETQLKGLGYQTTRLGGADRFATAVAVADALGDPSTVLLASGDNFPDALTAGPAAAVRGAAVLLTNGTILPAATADYLTAHASAVYAVGGPAALADPQAQAVVGADRFATAVAVATEFFASPPVVGIASGENYPDALSAGPLLAHDGAPLLLTATSELPGPTASYLTGKTSSIQLHIFGGPAAVSEGVQKTIEDGVTN
jgi:putative cell wall-binding protein